MELHQIFTELLGTNHVYFQPPETVKMVYPCILYKLSGMNVRHADDDKYLKRKQYTVYIIDRNPDSELPDKLLDLEYCSFDRLYVADNLYHFVYTIYY